MKRSLATGLLFALAAGSALAAPRQAGGPRYVHGGVRGGPPGHAVPRGGVRYAAPAAAYRHPRAHAGAWGYGYGGHGGRYYRPAPYRGYAPHYGYPYAAPYYAPYGFGLGVAFGFSGGYVVAGYRSPAPYYAAPAYAAVPYYAGPSYVAAPSYAAPSMVAFGAEPPPRDRGAETEAGEIRLSVTPDDAAVYVDGEFRGIARDVAALRLPPGRHHVEVARPGFRVEAREVDLAPGVLASVRIEMRRP